MTKMANQAEFKEKLEKIVKAEQDAKEYQEWLKLPWWKRYDMDVMGDGSDSGMNVGDLPKYAEED